MRYAGLLYLLLLLTMPSPTHADNLFQKQKAGYEVIWKGYAAITTCVNNQDHYDLGSYLFVCDKYTYEYPYHYGDVYLVTKSFSYNGAEFISSYICLNHEEDCIEGTIYKRWD
jgi:hypothetical protein